MCIGRRIGPSQGLLGKGSACNKASTGRRIGLSQKTVLGEGSAHHEGYTGEYEREYPADVHGALLDGSQRDKCKEFCATINGLEEIP